MDIKLMARRVLNLPAKATPEPTPADPWVVAGEKVATTSRATPWQLEDANPSQRRWQVVARTVVAIVVLLFLWIGVRTTFWPQDAPKAQSLPAAVTFPNEEAAATAERFTWSYLTWNQDAPAVRDTAMALDLAGADQRGWNGQGRQDVIRTIVAAVDVDKGGSTAQVTVNAYIRTYARAGAEWAPSGGQWSALEVPVALSRGRAVVSGAPGLVGIPAAQAVPEGPVQQEDTKVATSTKDAAKSFFTAYAEGDAAAVAAPGTEITAMTPGWKFDEVTTWTVYAGSDDQRQATAVVRFTSAADVDVKLDQTYTVTLNSVTAKAGTRWQVSAVHGG